MPNKNKSLIIALPLLAGMIFPAVAERKISTLTDGWEFTKGRPDASTKWESVRVPHDWAITGPFDRANDLQTVAVEQNGETEKTGHTHRQGLCQGSETRHDAD